MHYPNNIEDICYEESYIEPIITEMKLHFHDYFYLSIRSRSNFNGVTSIKVS